MSNSTSPLEEFSAIAAVWNYSFPIAVSSSFIYHDFSILYSQPRYWPLTHQFHSILSTVTEIHITLRCGCCVTEGTFALTPQLLGFRSSLIFACLHTPEVLIHGSRWSSLQDCRKIPPGCKGEAGNMDMHKIIESWNLLSWKRSTKNGWVKVLALHRAPRSPPSVWEHSLSNCSLHSVRFSSVTTVLGGLFQLSTFPLGEEHFFNIQPDTAEYHCLRNMNVI